MPDVADDNNANQADKLETKSQPPIYVCRAIHSSVWVAGMLTHKEKRCTVTIHGIVKSYENYELLENVDNAARITWVSWNKYTQPPVGAVFVNKMLLARYEIPAEDKSRYTHYIGTLSSSDNFGNIIYANEVSGDGSPASYFFFIFARRCRREGLNFSERE